MTSIKSQLLTILIVSFLVSCSFSNSQNEQENNDSKTTQNKKLKNVKVYDDTNGMVVLHFPIPKDWNYDADKNAEFMLTAPNNIKVAQPQPQTYAYANDAFSLQTLQQMQSQDFEIAPVSALSDILQNHVIPSAESQGYTLIKDYKLPGVLNFLQRYESGILKTGMKSEFHVLGTDWKDSNGNKSFIVFVQTIMYKHGFIYWTLQSTELEAPTAHFNDAKDAFIYALANRQINMAWQQVKNRELLESIRSNNAYWEKVTRQSQIQHNQRMAAIESRGNTARAIGNTYSDILDISHSGYLKRDAMNSAGYSKTVNMIGERSTISSTATGEQYNVKAGSKFYWVNTNGEYFGTDNAFYDPRVDNRVNNSEWTQFEINN
ncbi:hypothetical protein [Winogradskyella thalassocola]|uniref:Lipoprotein n=1 Tax=Winogradskyella thalassocola TaxID=262004 RepID=A0A1G8GS72_9FLAO|nr:hypothetical protein [Winogradskyella thalassocola]SDH97187.1 hypothetical protein SAMN04489796_10612 [Winogradskyella thalassocola]